MRINLKNSASELATKSKLTSTVVLAVISLQMKSTTTASLSRLWGSLVRLRYLTRHDASRQKLRKTPQKPSKRVKLALRSRHPRFKRRLASADPGSSRGRNNIEIVVALSMGARFISHMLPLMPINTLALQSRVWSTFQIRNLNLFERLIASRHNLDWLKI